MTRAAEPTTLFSCGSRPADPSLPSTASAYARLDCDPADAGDRLRRTLEGWFGRLPVHARPSLGAAFRRSRLPDHLGAFWELYVHELALRLAYDVDVDIGREDPGWRRPDFLLRRDDRQMWVEATVILGDDAIHPADRTRVDQLYDAIERIEVRDYLLDVRTAQVGDTTPGRRSIGRPLERWLRELDYDQVLALRETDSPRPQHTFGFDDWVVHITASAWLPELRGRPDLGVIGSKTEGVGRVADVDTFKHFEDAGPIGRELRRKAGWYGELDHPFVIAALCAGPLVTDHDIAQGLIGPIRYRLDPRGGGASGGYEHDGLWLGPEGLRNRRVSGVLTVASLRPTAIAVVEPVLWTAPEASHPLTCSTPLRSFDFDQTARVTERPAASAIAQIFGLA
jgi:hypothetical protein